MTQSPPLRVGATGDTKSNLDFVSTGRHRTGPTRCMAATQVMRIRTRGLRLAGLTTSNSQRQEDTHLPTSPRRKSSLSRCSGGAPSSGECRSPPGGEIVGTTRSYRQKQGFATDKGWLHHTGFAAEERNHLANRRTSAAASHAQLLEHAWRGAQELVTCSRAWQLPDTFMRFHDNQTSGLGIQSGEQSKAVRRFSHAAHRQCEESAPSSGRSRGAP